MSWFEVISRELQVIFISMVPIVELRGAIPYGVSLGMSSVHATILAVLGGMVPVPFILLLIRPILNYFHARNIARNLIHGLTRTTVRNKAKIQRYGFWGIILVVAIPLPGTGVWSGSLAAALLDLRMKRALPAILIGNMIAGLLVLLISYGFVLIG